jgi:hypothetical protein
MNWITTEMVEKVISLAEKSNSTRDPKYARELGTYIDGLTPVKWTPETGQLNKV